ncbi:MAG: phosphoadenosine phosphosulfate reductase family protein [Oscillospiraceae bacterium]|nr:phosphoadenosine phosphosulfate reductase family protein [Oscillospiraceae bacterium]
MPTRKELKLYQSLPLEIKIAKTQVRILEWAKEFGIDGIYVSFSGGKDSTVLLHLVRDMFPKTEAVFVDTGLEYPEVREFARSFENVTVLRPKMNFAKVIQTYGYPMISKEIARRLQYARKAVAEGRQENHGDYRKLCGLATDKSGNRSRYNCEKYKPLLDVPIYFGSECCTVMKKKPLKQYVKKTGKLSITATMACESLLREEHWLRHGCNAFDAKRPMSQPMSFWTEQDVLKYIKINNLKIASVYGDVVPKNRQLAFDCFSCDEALCTTGCNRTGCVFCGFGAHLERGENRFQRLKRTHPKLYQYCIFGGAYDSDGLWKPDKNGLGMGHVFDALNRIYGDDFIRYE